MKNLIKAILSKFNLQISRAHYSIIHKDKFLNKIHNNKSFSFFVNEGFHYYDNLLSIGFKFDFNGNNNIKCSYNNIYMNIECFEELYILNEIYYEGVYSFIYPDKCNVIDIGMNVGFASLYFASIENVSQVYSFEPLPITFNKGAQNFNLNEILTDKIKAHNFGVGNFNRKEIFNYSVEWKGSVGLRNLISEKTKDSSEIIRVEVEIRDILLTLDEIRHLQMPLVAKIDCEGAEYEIIERLEESGKLREFDLFMIEWHDNGPEKIISMLKKAGFTTITSHPYLINNVGMIYAFRVD
jgi:FkbM family methyltransferase